MSPHVISSLVISLKSGDEALIQDCLSRLVKVPGLEIVDIVDKLSVAVTLECASIQESAQCAQRLEDDPQIASVRLVFCQTDVEVDDA